MRAADRLDLVRDLLARGSSVRFIVRGGSMWPWLRDGSAVTIRPRQPCRGEIALAVLGAEAIVHRLVHLDETNATLSGDALDGSELVPTASILGTVTSARLATAAWPLVRFTRLAARCRRGWRRLVDRDGSCAGTRARQSTGIVDPGGPGGGARARSSAAGRG